MAELSAGLVGPDRGGLLDLTTDCLNTILRLLGAQDLSACAQVCRRMSELIMQDDCLWEWVCQQYLQSPESRAAGTDRQSPAQLREQLGLQTCRSVYQALHRLRGWPVGLWQRVDRGCEPYGELVQVSVKGRRLEGRPILATGQVQDPIFSAAIYPAPAPSSQVFVAGRSYAGSEASLRLSEASQRLELRTGQTPSGFIRNNGPLLHRILQQPAAEVAAGQAPPVTPRGAARQPLGLGPLAWDHTRQQWVRMFHPLDSDNQQNDDGVAFEQTLEFRRLPLPPPPRPNNGLLPLPACDHGFPAIDALRRLEGYWSACYGPHGLEILHLRVAEATDPPEPACPCGTQPRLLARKVTGDPNVPAGNITLLTLDGAPTLGRYDGFDADATDPERPVVSFQEDGMAFVDLSEREIMARYRARGQMNYVPGVWDPFWSRGQVLLYEGDLAAWSMLFLDDGEQFRHIIDSTPLPLVI